MKTPAGKSEKGYPIFHIMDIVPPCNIVSMPSR
ncbi:hypothetical protein FHS82_003690 [Pseudochelatococcus lubricantis]|uniref:Uncharacterized protein n=1 Tax=Pseudochelatococcus lubricantis TaxID=1538102 RepID=A0ABX0V6V9_9HYPH|nr:hypothetical protein [Pseudochelatococcus lubricantis]